MKRILVLFMCLLMLCSLNIDGFKVYALNVEQSFVVYDTEGNYLFERIEVTVGDEYIDKAFNSYEVISVDSDTHTGVAKFVGRYAPREPLRVVKPIGELKKIGLYMSHNDESYVSGDGYDSVYGAGGIHDIAKRFSQHLQGKNVAITLDETLHIPHDTYAYSRSKNTANKIINSIQPDAIFDIHRDGTSRGFYVANVNGEERCMVRIVIGKSNPNMAVNRDFALSLMSTANDMCPWLFVDLFVGQGHYNQSLHNKALLFEMGSHLVEKDLVMRTTEELANVVYRTIYGEEVIEVPTLPDSNVGSVEDNIVDSDILPPDEGQNEDNIDSDNLDNSENSHNETIQNNQDLVQSDLAQRNNNGNVFLIILAVLLISIIVYFLWRAYLSRKNL